MAIIKVLQVCGLLSALVSLGQAQSTGFNIQVASARKTPSLVNSYVKTSPTDFTDLLISNQGIPTTFLLNDNGILRAQGDRAPAIRGTPGDDGQVGIFFTTGYGAGRALKCAIDTDNALACYVGDYSTFVECTYRDGTPAHIYLTKPGSGIPDGCERITLKAKTDLRKAE